MIAKHTPARTVPRGLAEPTWLAVDAVEAIRHRELIKRRWKKSDAAGQHYFHTTQPTEVITCLND